MKGSMIVSGFIVFAPDEVPTPYALAIHPGTQEVWVNDTMLDLVWRFLPDEERFAPDRTHCGR